MTGRGRPAALSLYRGILRAHRKMPTEIRLLGDTYVRSEFKLHKPVTNEAQIEAFFVAWEQYLGQMMATARRRGAVEAGVLESKEEVEEAGFGQHLPLDLELSDEQKAQLEKLREETSQGRKPS